MRLNCVDYRKHKYRYVASYIVLVFSFWLFPLSFLSTSALDGMGWDGMGWDGMG